MENRNTTDSPEIDVVVNIVDDLPQLNIVEFEYMLLHSLSAFLGDARVTRYNETEYSFKLADDMRARVQIKLESEVICTQCNTPIDFPNYSQMQPDTMKHDGLRQKCNVTVNNVEPLIDNRPN